MDDGSKCITVLVSMRMNGVPEEEVRTNFGIVKDFLEQYNPFPGKIGFYILDTYDHEDPEHPVRDERLWYLGKSISQMSEADLVIFWDDWGKGNGCRVEAFCAQRYRIPFFELSKEIKGNDIVVARKMLKTIAVAKLRE